MTLVVDSSVIAALLTDTGTDGTWARAQLSRERLAAPQHMPVEVTSVLRRLAGLGAVSHEAATLALDELLQLRVLAFGYRGFGKRVWELRENLVPYDAWYVALAEHLGAPLVTLDRRLTKAPGPRCEFRVPPGRDTIQTGME